MKKVEFIERYGEEAYQRRLEQKKQYREAHKEQIKEYQKQYREAHKEQIKEYREEFKQYQKQYFQQHKEEFKQWKRKKQCMFAYCIPEEWEQIENYELAKKDNFDGWDIHHRLETHNSDGERRLVNISRTELIALEMYYNRPANELIFLTKSEHSRLHRKCQ